MVSPYAFLCSRGKEMFAAKYQLEEKYHLSQEEIDYLYDHYTREKDFALWVKYLPRTCYYMMRGIYDLFGYGTTNKLEDFYTLCQTLGVEPPRDFGNGPPFEEVPVDAAHRGGLLLVNDQVAVFVLVEAEQGFAVDVRDALLELRADAPLGVLRNVSALLLGQ